MFASLVTNTGDGGRYGGRCATNDTKERNEKYFPRGVGWGYYDATNETKKNVTMKQKKTIAGMGSMQPMKLIKQRKFFEQKLPRSGFTAEGEGTRAPK